MAITIDKLIERLEDLREELNGNGQIEDIAAKDELLESLQHISPPSRSESLSR